MSYTTPVILILVFDIHTYIDIAIKTLMFKIIRVERVGGGGGVDGGWWVGDGGD